MAPLDEGMEILYNLLCRCLVAIYSISTYIEIRREKLKRFRHVFLRGREEKKGLLKRALIYLRFVVIE